VKGSIRFLCHERILRFFGGEKTGAEHLAWRVERFVLRKKEWLGGLAVGPTKPGTGLQPGAERSYNGKSSDRKLERR
jgi:hypothetical protein